MCQSARGSSVSKSVEAAAGAGIGSWRPSYPSNVALIASTTSRGSTPSRALTHSCVTRPIASRSWDTPLTTWPAGISPCRPGALAWVTYSRVSSPSLWQVGMYGFMALTQFFLFPHLAGDQAPVNSVEFWAAMQIATVARFLTSYPVNWWLVGYGIRSGCKGHSFRSPVQARGRP